MKRRGFLASLFGGVAAVAASKSGADDYFKAQTITREPEDAAKEIAKAVWDTPVTSGSGLIVQTPAVACSGTWHWNY